MIDIRIDEMAYDAGKPITWRAMASVQSLEGKDAVIYGKNADTKDEALCNLISECEKLFSATSEVIQLINTIKLWK